MKIFGLLSLASLGFSAPVFLPPETSENLTTLEVSGLYWQTKLWGVEFASKSKAPLQTVPGTLQYKQKVVTPDFAFSRGFKVEFGGGIYLDQFNLSSRWTCMNSGLTHKQRYLHKNIVPAGEGMVPLWYEPLPVPPQNPVHFWKAKDDWRLVFNAFDLELGRAYFPFSAMVVKMFLGVKGSYIRQNYRVRYNRGTSIASGVSFDQCKMIFHGIAAGAGPRAGFDSKWSIGWGFNIIADGAFSILFTSVGMGTKFINKFSAPLLNSSSHMKEKEQELVPVLEGKLGFDWGRWFGSSFYFGVMIAYEAQYWWSQNHIRRNFAYKAPGNMWDMRGDLQLRGLTASIRSEF